MHLARAAGDVGQHASVLAQVASCNKCSDFDIGREHVDFFEWKGGKGLHNNKPLHGTMHLKQGEIAGIMYGASNSHCNSAHLDLLIVMRGQGSLTNTGKQAPIVNICVLLKVPQVHVRVNENTIGRHIFKRCYVRRKSDILNQERLCRGGKNQQADATHLQTMERTARKER